MPDLITIRAIATYFIAGTVKRAREDERGLTTMEYAAIAVAVVAVAAIIAAVILRVATQKAHQIG